VKVNGIAQYVNWNDPIVEPETVLDYELGLRYMSETFSCALNLYYMDFRNEVVALGAVDKDGFPVKGNADKTLHMGLEFDAAGKLHSHLEIYANVAYSKNYFKKYLQNIITDWDTYEVGITDVSGNRIAGFPDLIGNFRVVGYWKNLSLSLAYKYIGKQFLDNTESENRRIDPFGKVDMTLNYRFMDVLYFKQVRFIFNVINLLNEEYETAGYYDSWEGIAYYYPGAHRNYYFGITFSL
jgi:iron complex outermembrane receptor protein